MDTIRKYRSSPNNVLNRACGIEELTEFITSQSPEFPVTYFQYRAMENGQTKDVPIHVILSAAVLLGIPAHELFPELDA
jgi:hypothetical protein